MAKPYVKNNAAGKEAPPILEGGDYTLYRRLPDGGYIEYGCYRTAEMARSVGMKGRGWSGFIVTDKDGRDVDESALEGATLTDSGEVDITPDGPMIR